MKQTTAFNALRRCMEEFRKVDPQLPMQRAMTFVLVALNEGCTLKRLADWTGTVQSTASRNVQALGRYANQSGGKEGFDLLRTEPDLEDPKGQRKLVYLTPKGRRVADALFSYLETLGERDD